MDMETEAEVVLPDRNEKHTLPTKVRIMSMLSMAVIPEERRAFRRRFRQASRKDVEGNDMEQKPCATGVSDMCAVPISWIAKAFECEPFQLRCAGDMFPESRIESEFLNEFYVMDVVLNRAPKAAATDSLQETDYDVVRPVISYREEDLGSDMDYFYRAAILFLPQCGKFYCHRERRKGEVGVPGTFTAHDMSWLRLQRTVTRKADGQFDVSYAFGKDSFVRRFFFETQGEPVLRNEERRADGWRFLDENHRISAWRISTGRKRPSQQNRVIYRAIQCRDSDGPILPPDILQGEDRGTVPQDYLAAEYRRLFASANSVRKDGRHYVGGCRHYRLPKSCWIIDPFDTHFFDVMVDTDDAGGTRNRQSVVMVRNVTKIDGDGICTGFLDHITAHNMRLRKAGSKGCARPKGEDVGTMHPIGTGILLDRTGTVPFAANRKVPEGVLRKMVVNLSKVGSRCFPQAYAVIRDMEQDSGLLPLEPMNGMAITDDEGGAESDDGGNEDVSDDGDVDDDGGNSACAIAHCKRIAKARIALRKRVAVLERRRRVGYTIDMSINLGNASHYDVHDASQGFSVWTEEVPGLGANWFFVLPNVHGKKPDGTEFRGMAVKLGHGVAISWDGRVIRHCTSASHPDGMERGRVGEVKDSHFKNHLYGTFSAAKEKIVRMGRAVSAAKHQELSSSSGGHRGPVPWAKKRRKTRRQKGRKSRKSRRGRQVDIGDSLELMLGVEGGDSGQESGSGSSGEGEDNSSGPDPTVGVEAVDVRKESVVGSPSTGIARRVLPALLQRSDTDMMTEYERIAANEAHFRATVDPTSRHLLSGYRGVGERLFRVDPRIEQQYYREQKRAAVGADCAVGCDRVQEKIPDVGSKYKIPRKGGKPANTKFY
jgi:hypothetical protein